MTACSPTRPRRSPARRWLTVLLRTAHLAGIAGTAATSGAPDWLGLLLISGVALAAEEWAWGGLVWLQLAQAQAILLKVALLAVALAVGAPVFGFWAALLIGGLIAHAPGGFRHASLTGDPGPCAPANGGAR